MIDDPSDRRANFAASAFFAKTYGDALDLAEQARAYMAGTVKAERTVLDGRATMHATAEMFRLSARITQMIAWMLVQRAVEQGEISADQAGSDEYRLGSRDTCLKRDRQTIDRLPPALEDLMTRSEQLYIRVARLDDMLARDGG